MTLGWHRQILDANEKVEIAKVEKNAKDRDGGYAMKVEIYDKYSAEASTSLDRRLKARVELNRKAQELFKDVFALRPAASAPAPNSATSQKP